MIYRNKRLDDNGPMGASLITLNQRHPDDAFQKYIETTNHHIMVSEPRLADGTIARLWPHENTIWADDAFMAVSFISRMGEVTGEKKYFDDAANQILNYTRYLWCPENRFIIIAIIRIIRNMEWRIGPGPMDGFLWRQPICWQECRKIILCVRM